MRRFVGRFWQFFWLGLWAAAVMAAAIRGEAAAIRGEAAEVGPPTPPRVAILDTGLDVTDKRFRVCGWHDATKTGITDDHGHGTHVAGIITALGEKAPCLLVCKYYLDSAPGSVNLARTIECLRWAISKKADYINYSGGGPEASHDELLALRVARSAGVEVVVAAGNDHEDIDLSENHYYPASYLLPGMHVVGGIEDYGKRTSTSNYGSAITDMALGDDLFSSLPNGKSGYMSGTSQATAIVTGGLIRQRLGLEPISRHDARCYLLRYWKPTDFKCP